MIDRTARQHENECGPRTTQTSKTPARLVRCRWALTPRNRRPWSRVGFRSLEKWARAWRPRTLASGRGPPRMAHILEPETLNSLEFFCIRQILFGPGVCREAGGCRGTHIALIATGIVAIGNRGNRQLTLAWDDSLVTPLRSLDRPENLGTRSPVLGFW
jgi:hypothetical protein